MASSCSRGTAAPTYSSVEDVTTFAWDGADAPTVKLYLSLGTYLDGPLDASKVTVRFAATNVQVAVDGGSKLLKFERNLFEKCSPSKCTFKVNEAKKVVVLGIKKKKKDLVWKTLQKDVNVADTVPAKARAAE